MDFETAKKQLAKWLRALDPSGSEAFEGLTRDILSSFTAQTFRLNKSGPQDGSDMRNSRANVVRIALEAKRYRSGTKLKFDELEAKVSQAARGPDPTDLWILAATREISDTDKGALDKTGIDRGVAVRILDWPAAVGVLPGLAVLCAAERVATARRLGNPVDFDAVMDAIEEHSDFEWKKAELHRDFTSPDVGFDASNRHMRGWTLAGLKDPLNAASRLGAPYHDLLATDRPRIARPKLAARLDDWFASGLVGVLTGDEGMGKTWLFLSWWHDLVEADPDRPIMLFVSAKDVVETDVEQLLARLLYQRLRSHNQGFWLRRLRQWLSSDLAPRPQFILAIDGLNQNPNKRDWAELLQPLSDVMLRGRVAVIMTSWPAHWQDLQALGSLTPQPIEIPVGRFDQDELAALLKGYGLKIGDFAKGMEEVLSVPRLSQRAIALRRQMADSHDITPERLAVEDWKGRIELRGASLGIDDDEFRDFVTGLSEELRVSIDDAVFTRKDLLDRLGRESGKDADDLGSTVAELVAGRWLEPESSRHRYKVNKTLVPFALGLTLAQQLRHISEQSEATAVIAKFMDPFRGHSLGAAIVRAGLTSALLDVRVSAVGRRALLERWIGEQNFGSADFDVFWRQIGLDVDLFLSFVEETWLNRRSHGFLADEVLIKGLARAYRFPEVSPKIKAKMTEWMGWYWLDPFEGMVLGQVDPTTEEAIDRRRQTEGNAEAWLSSQVRGDFPAVALAPTGDPSWLGHRALGVLSYLPRVDFMDAIGAWTISRSIMAVKRHFEELAWLIRINGEDTEDALPGILSYAERLLGTGDPILLRAGKWLLEALATPEAEERLLPLRPAQGDLNRLPALSPDIGAVVYPAGGVTPDDSYDADDVRRMLSQPLDDRFHSQRALLTLARNNPKALRDRVGELTVLPEDLPVAQLKRAVGEVYSGLAVLTRDERERLVEALLAMDPGEDRSWLQSRLFELRILDMPRDQHLEFTLSEGFEKGVYATADSTLLDFTTTEVMEHLETLSSCVTDAEVERTLRFMIEFGSEEALKGFSFEPAWLTHSDDEIRRRAIGVASRISDPRVLSAFADSGWKAKGVDDRTERCEGSLCLMRASRLLERPELMARVDPDMFAIDLQNNPTDVEAVARYGGYVKVWLDQVKSSRQSSRDPLVDHSDAIDILLDKVDQTFLSWLEAWVDAIPEQSNLILLQHFPVVDICSALLRRHPLLGVRLWRKLFLAETRGLVKLETLHFLPFQAPAGDEADEARNLALIHCKTDYQLSELVRIACRHGQFAWLVAAVDAQQSLGTPEGYARALTMLGFADADQAIDEKWQELERTIPEFGWLAAINQEARASYERNRYARYWYEQFHGSAQDADILATHLLLGAVVDRRAYDWIKSDRLRTLPDKKRIHWHLGAGRLDKAIKDRRKRLQETFFFTKIMKGTHWPWR